jgi:hypothetical protein
MRRITGFIIVLLISVSVNAQQGVKFGIKADPQISWFNVGGNVFSQQSGRLGFDIGLVIDKYFTENYAFTTGISIHMTGSTVVFEDSVTLNLNLEDMTIPKGEELTYKLQYLSIPLGLKLKTREFGYVTYFGQLGVTPEVNVRALADSDYGEINDLDAVEEINFFQLSYHIGGGIEYGLGGSTAIAAGVYYYNGFTDITENEKDKATLNLVKLRLAVMF